MKKQIKKYLPDWIKRNSTAPALDGSLVRNRGQFLVEKFIQNYNIPLQEYINNGKVLSIIIPITQLREWYPGPNWKKDLSQICLSIMSRPVSVEKPNGDFRYYHLFSYANLDEKGLQLEVLPSVLQCYLINKDTIYTQLDYAATRALKTRYSHQLYLLCCQHNCPQFQYSFTLTPNEINTFYRIKYTPHNILQKIIEPVCAELRNLYDISLSDVCFSYIVIKDHSSSAPILRFDFTVHSNTREQKNALIIKDWNLYIDEFINKYLPLKRIIIMKQIHTLPYNKLGKLYSRIKKLEIGELETKENKPAYICQILLSDEYNINPNTIPSRIDIHKKIAASVPVKDEQFVQKELKFNEYAEQWVDFLEAAKTLLPPLTVAAWIDPIAFKDFDNLTNSLHIIVPNAFFHEYIEKNLIDKLVPLIRQIFGEHTKVMYHIATQ